MGKQGTEITQSSPLKTPPGLAVQAGTASLMTDVAAVMERSGLPSFWTSEFYDRSAVATLAAVAATTSRIRLGSSIAWAFGRTPITLATDFRSLSELAPGRISMGLGTGNPQVISDWHGLTEKHSVSRLIELVQLVREIWTANERPVTHDGRHYRCHLAADPMLPNLADNPPRVLLAGGRLPMINAAGAVADGLIGMPLSSRRFVEEVVRPALAASAARAGRTEEIPIIGMIICAIGDDTARTRTIAASQVAAFAVRASAEPLMHFHGFSSEIADIREAAGRNDFPGMIKAVSDRMLDALAVYGTPAEAMERYQVVFDGLYDEPLLFASGKGLPLGGFREGLLALCETFANGNQKLDLAQFP